jgi:hypothetical protein
MFRRILRLQLLLGQLKLLLLKMLLGQLKARFLQPGRRLKLLVLLGILSFVELLKLLAGHILLLALLPFGPVLLRLLFLQKRVWR